MKRKLKKLLCHIMLILMIFQATPVHAWDIFSDILPTGKIREALSNNSKKEDEEELMLKDEIIEKRELNKKYFRTNNGTTAVAIYSTDVHFEKDGQLIDIDNSIAKTKDNKLENKNGAYKVKYSNLVDSHELFSVENKGYLLKWKINNPNKVNVKEAIEKEDTKSKYDKTNLKNIRSKVEYKEILKNIDITYENLSNKIKESIILKNKNVTNIIEFNLSLDERLVPVLKEDNSIEIKDKEEIIYLIEKPYMYDANGEYSEDIKLELEKQESSYLIRMNVNKEWLDDKDRKYPVVIDPTVMTKQINSAIQDTIIYEGDQNNPPSNRMYAHFLRIGSNNLASLQRNPVRAIIKFDLPTLNSGDQIVDAIFNIANYPQHLDGFIYPTSEIEFNVHKMTSYWESASAYWSNLLDKYDSKVADYILYNYNTSSPSNWYKFNITSMVKDWYTTGNNYGLVMKEANEVKNLARSDAYFYSSDCGNANAIPTVVITYRNQSGLEDYQTYSSHSVGNTNVFVNNYNGNLVLTHQDASTPGNRLPVSINHVYNTNERLINNGYGYGFRLNLNQIIFEKTSTLIAYIDEDATYHYFNKNGDVFKDEDGLGLTVTKVGNEYFMEDNGGNKLKFIPTGFSWVLKEITDTDNNKIIINYDTSNYNLILSVNDGAGKAMALNYSGGMLSSITDLAGRTTYYYYTNTNLTSIKYPDNKIVYYEYNGNRQVTKITAIDGSYNIYGYYGSQPYRAYDVKEYGTNGALGNTLTFTYDENTTSIKDNKNYKNNYSFNSWGETTSITNLGNSNTINNVYGTAYKYEQSSGKEHKLSMTTNLIKSTNNLILNSSAEKDASNWGPYNSGTNLGTLSIATNESYIGNKSFKISTTTKNDTFPFYYQNQPVDLNKTYTFSAYAKGNISESSCIDECGALLVFEYKNPAQGIYIYRYKVLDLTDNWQRFSITDKAPDNFVGSLQVFVAIRNAKGTAYFDALQFEEGEVVNNHNLVDNGSFQRDASGWTPSSNNANDKVVSIDNGKVFQLTGDAKLAKNIYQFIPINGKKGDSFNVSFLAKNTGVPFIPDTKVSRLVFEFEDLSGNIVQKTQIHVPSDSTNWQFISEQIVANQDFRQIKVSLTFNYNKGVTYYTNVGIYKDESGTSYVYNSNGKVVSAKDQAKQNISFKYDIKNQLISNITPRGRSFIYNYDDNVRNRLLRGVNASGVSYNLSYDKYGNLTNYKVEESSIVRDVNDIDPNKVYYIRSAVSDLYMAAIGSVDINGTNVALATKGGYSQWQIKPHVNGNYRIEANKSGSSKQSIDISGNSNTNGANVQTWGRQDTQNQEFQIVKNNNGTFTFKTRTSSFTRCIDVTSARFEKGTNIVQYDCNGTDAQQFIIEEVDMSPTVNDLSEIDPNKTYYIKSVTYDLYMAAIGSVDINGTNVALSSKSSIGYDEWQIKPHVNGNYRIEANKSGDSKQSIDISGNSNTNGANVQTWGRQNTQNQEFQIVKNINGTFTFKTRTSNFTRCMDIVAAGFVNGTNIVQYDCNGTNAQQFIIEEVNSNTKKYVESKSEYSTDGRYQTKIINQREKSTLFTYNNNTGTLFSTTNANNTITSYEYDNMDKLTNMTSGNTSNGYTYINDRLSNINHNNINYGFVYDVFGNMVSTKIGSQALITNTYEANNGNLTKNTYGNGQEISYTYDTFNRVNSKTNNLNTINYTYDNRGNLGKLEIKNTQGTIINTSTYNYDLSDRLIRYQESSNYLIDYKYDNFNNISKRTCRLSDITKPNNYTFDLDNKIIDINNIKYSYDSLERLSTRKIGNTYETKYNYLDINSTKTTTLIESIENGSNNISYTYDNLGNVETVKENTILVNEYEYDFLNQLTVDNDYKHDKKYEYLYDTAGNMLSKREYQLNTNTLTNTINYQYNNTNWTDQLTNYDGKTISYDSIGNPTSYDGYTYTWVNGRELQSISNGTNTYSYKYNDSGIRTEKTVNNITTKYYLEGTDIIFEDRNGSIIYYNYDTTGVSGFEYNNNQYYFVKNLQGDVIGILDSSFNQIVTYEYDSWGNLLNITDISGINLGEINPFRYRSYYYDSEIGLYYLNSRYYNPEMGRFINADGIIGANQDLLSYNLYAYVSNNPVNFDDPSGEGIFDILNGVKDGFIGTFTGIANTVMHPIKTAKAVVSDPFNTIKTAVLNTIDPFKTSQIVYNLAKGDHYGAGALYGNNLGTATVVGAGMGIKYGSEKISSNYLQSIIDNPSNIQGQPLWKVKVASNFSPQWNTGVLTQGTHIGQGFKALNGSDGLISWHPGSLHHFGGNPYWKISSGLQGTQRFPY